MIDFKNELSCKMFISIIKNREYLNEMERNTQFSSKIIQPIEEKEEEEGRDIKCHSYSPISNIIKLIKV